MVTTRLQKRKDEFWQLRVAQAVTLVEYLQSGEENDDWSGHPEWRSVIHPDRIKVIPQCIRDIAEDSVEVHDTFNWRTGEKTCNGWQWIAIIGRICRDLKIAFTYEACMGRGESQHRYGCAAYVALCAYVQARVNNMKKWRAAVIAIRFLFRFTTFKQKIMHERYKPGGPGYLESLYEYKHQKQKTFHDKDGH